MKKWDVVVFDFETNKVVSIVGKNLLRECDPGHGFHTVEKRESTTNDRIGDRYFTTHVEAGTRKVGDVLTELEMSEP